MESKCAAQAAAGREHLGHTTPPPGRQVACPMPTTRPPAENRNGDVEAARGHGDEVASAEGVIEWHERAKNEAARWAQAKAGGPATLTWASK